LAELGRAALQQAELASAELGQAGPGNIVINRRV